MGMVTGATDTRPMYLVQWQNGSVTAVAPKHVQYSYRPSVHDDWARDAVQRLMKGVTGSCAG
jgi:hypothetical protein